MSDLQELYQSVILDHNRKPRNFGELPAANREADGRNPLCGDEVHVALVVDEAICLCAIMGAESIGLPQPVNDQTRAFFQMNLTWLERLFEAHAGTPQPSLARLVVTALEGAIIVASNAQDRSVLADVTAELRQVVALRIKG